MSGFPLIISPEAEADLLDAFVWYESQREGLGEEFMLSFEAALPLLQSNPEMHPKARGEIRKALLRRFPYGIFYLFDNDIVRVVAVFHHRRNPSLLRDR